MIHISETDTEYLLKIPAIEKERAKKIQGRKWDSKRICWVYPKTEKIFEQLMAEFEEDLLDKSIQPVTSAKPDVKVYPISTKSDRNLQNDLEDIKNMLLELGDSSGKKVPETLIQLNSQVNALTIELNRTNEEIQKYEKKYLEINQKYEFSQKQISQLRNTLETYQNKSGTNRDLMELIKEKAKEATSNDLSFCKLLEIIDLNQEFVLNLGNQLESKLRKLLNNYDKGISLFNLINQASEEEKLTPDAIDFAHLIRRERNKFAHPKIYEKTIEAHILMCLFASALLWPDLPE